MNTVLVNKQELLETVKKNRDAHRAIFEEAIERYRKEVIKQLENHIALAKANKRIITAVLLPEPKDQTKEYDLAISMLEMSVDETVEITRKDFAQLVLDDWQWKEHFIGTVSNYMTAEEITTCGTT